MSKIKENVDITNLSNFKTKAVAKYYFEINNELDLDNLKEVIIFAQKNKLKYLFIGAGTNILFAFDIFEGILIKNNLVGWNYNIENKNLITYSNELISDISQDLKEKYGQNIFERFIGLPGSVGGAIYGNAGCFGLEISSNLLEIKVLNLDLGKIEILKKQDLNFTYRSSLLKEKQIYFLISAKFDLSINREKYSIGDIDIYDFRQNKQPKGNSCGSFFKNPSREFSAGFLIENIGLKGYNINGAYFSSKHSNFLMNDGSANYNDLLNLINLAKQKVFKKYNIQLKPEVNIIYN